MMDMLCHLNGRYCTFECFFPFSYVSGGTRPHHNSDGLPHLLVEAEAEERHHDLPVDRARHHLGHAAHLDVQHTVHHLKLAHALAHAHQLALRHVPAQLPLPYSITILQSSKTHPQRLQCVIRCA